MKIINISGKEENISIRKLQKLFVGGEISLWCSDTGFYVRYFLCPEKPKSGSRAHEITEKEYIEFKEIAEMINYL